MSGQYASFKHSVIIFSYFFNKENEISFEGTDK